MLTSHQWPAMPATHHVSKPPRLAPIGDLDPVLQRLLDVLKCDYVAAAKISANAEAAVICSVGSYCDNIRCLLERQVLCASNDCRVSPHCGNASHAAAPQIILAQAADNNDSLLSIWVPAGPHTIAIIAVRSAGRMPFGLADERVLQRYAGWVADYVGLWSRLMQGEQRRTGFERALDQVGLAMIMLDRDGRKIATNCAARTLLEDGDGLIAVGETLSAAVLEDAVRLHTAIGHALVGTMHGALAPVLTIRRNRRRQLVIAVLRVAADPQPGETAIVLQIIEPDRNRDAAITASCTLFGFTGAEARLAKLLVEGATLAEAATALRIQMPTARTYLKQAFAKSGTNRQAALVQVLLSSLVHPKANTLLTAV